VLHVSGRTANIGQYNTVIFPTAQYGANVAIGGSSDIFGGRGNTVLGYDNSTSSSTVFSTAVGVVNDITSSTGGHAFGLYNQVSGLDAFAIGNRVVNSIDQTIQIGWNNSDAPGLMTLTSDGNVGIGTTAPVSQLHTTGSVTFSGAGIPAVGRVLTSDASGNATWQNPQVSGGDEWLLLGNAGTNPSTNFIGTTDAQDFVVRTSNTERIRVLSTGNVGIGTSTPDAVLHVEGRTANIGHSNTVVVPTGSWGANVAIGGSSDIFGGRGNTVLGYDNSTSSSTVFSTAIGVCNDITSSTGGHAFGLYNQVSGIDALAIGNYVVNSIDQTIQLGWNYAPAAGAVTITSSGSVGIGTTAPAAQLHTTGSVRLTGAGTPAAGYVLTSDAIGNATWQAPAGGTGNYWSLTGNAGTNPSTNFIGTTDAQEFTIRTNNMERFRITTKGQIKPINTGYSVFIGNLAGENDDHTNNYNVFLGANSGQANTTGYNNIAVGQEALVANINGYDNVALGTRALYTNTTGSQNIAIGYWALQNATSAIGNTSVGYYSLYQNKGGYNTAVGWAAGAGVSGPTYTYCTFLGYDADFSSGGTYNNAMALGNGATATATNYVRVGNTAVTQIGGQVGWSTLSDGRVKNNVKEDVSGLDFIMKLRPVTFNIDKDKQDKILNKKDKSEYDGKYDIEKITFSGFIAQEVEQAAKECGYDFSGVKKPKHDNDLYGLTYSDFVVPLVKAAQEQQKLIQEQQTKIKDLQQQIDELKSLIKVKD